jgi:membrane glycosyltransferase
VLSDTTNAEVAREEDAYADLRTGWAPARLSYRRAANTGKKAGNIAEWVATRGPDYAHMIVLDADSLMQGDTMVRLAALMEANPRTGLIQTHIVPAGRETLFARMLQFSSRVTGVVLAMGNSCWQTSEANYFGHNAILRLGLRRVLPPDSPVRPAAARGRNFKPRFRRGSLPAPRRLVLLAAA